MVILFFSLLMQITSCNTLISILNRLENPSTVWTKRLSLFAIVPPIYNMVSHNWHKKYIHLFQIK